MSTKQNHIVLGDGDLTLDAYGLQKMVIPYTMFHSLFTFDVPVKMWANEINGVEENLLISTLVTSVNSMLNVKTAANNGDITYLHSRRHPRFQANRGHLYSASIIIPTPTDAAVEDWGLFTDINGVFFRVKVDGELYACIQSGGSITHQEKITMPFELDLTKGHIYDIQFQWHGVGDYKFFISDPKTGVLKLVHHIKLLGTLAGLSIENPSLPAAYRVTSLGDAGVIKSGCVDITIEGGRDGREQYGAAETRDKSVSGTDIPVLIIYNPKLINGKVNTRDIRLARITGTSDKRTDFTVWVTRDPTAFTGAAFNSVNFGSYIEKDIAAIAVDTAKLQFLTAFKTEANTSNFRNNPEPTAIDFFATHGDYIVVTMTGSTAQCSAVVEWGEEI